VAGSFGSVGLDDCSKQQLYTAWGATLQSYYGKVKGWDPAVEDGCFGCKSIPSPDVTLSTNTSSGMVSRLGITINASVLPTGYRLGSLRASPKTPPFTDVPLIASSAAGWLPYTGRWDASFTLVKANNQTDTCELPSQEVRCMPGFINTTSGGCVCPEGQTNSNGICTGISVCDASTLTILPNRTTDGTTVTVNDTSTIRLSFADPAVASNVRVLMRPVVPAREKSALDVSALLGLGEVAPGKYEIELEMAGTRCRKLSSVTVRCSDRYVAQGVDGKCVEATCTGDEWADESGRCRQKAQMTVQASSEQLEMTLYKSESVRSVSRSVEFRLQTGDIPSTNPISWEAKAAADWLSLDLSSGSVHSSASFSVVRVTANGKGCGDTSTTELIDSRITFRSRTALMTSNAFVNGTEHLTIDVRLRIIAIPYVNDSHVTILSSSGHTVRLGESVDAGDQLTVTVEAVDAEGLPIVRPDLPLRLDIVGKLNKHRSTPLAQTSNASNTYKATVPELWVREPETVQSEVFAPSLPIAVIGCCALNPCYVPSVSFRSEGGAVVPRSTEW
jgi:hypothetical protein